MPDFIRRVSASFLSRLPSQADRNASASVDVKVGRKLLESLVEVGLREALAEYVTFRGIELVTLKTASNRRAQVVAHVALTIVFNIDVTLTAEIEVGQTLGDGLQLHVHSASAKGKGWFIDRFAAGRANAAFKSLIGTTLTVEAVKLAGASVERLEIQGEDPVRIVVALRDAVMPNIV